MKTLKNFIRLTTLTFLLLLGCQKNENSPLLSHYTPDAIEKAGKVNPAPPYVLASEATPLQVYGVWHAGNDYCTWGTERTVTEFDSKNHWIIDRGDGKPSVNLVVLSFVNPLKLLNKTDDVTTVGGIPKGMTPVIVNYFKSKGIRVMLSIGGITYTKDWNTALAANAMQLGFNAAEVAGSLGVGIEIDYEEASSPNLTGLQAFITAYRSVHPYDATGEDHAARLTIDLAAGDRWLIGICQKATAEWLTIGNPVLDYANAMVPARQPSASEAIANWDEHIDGKPQYVPKIPPLAPCKFTGSLYMTGSKAVPECNNFMSSIQYIDREYVTKIMPNGAGSTAGMLGYMFWAAECNSTRQLCTTDCTGGIGAGAIYFNIPIPMPGLRRN